MLNKQSGSALRWFAIVLLVIGAVVTDPAGGFVFTTLAVSVDMAVASWPAAKSHLATYQERVTPAAPKNITLAGVPENG